MFLIELNIPKMIRLQPIHHRISTNRFDAARLLSEPEIRELVELATEAPSSFKG